MPAAENTWLRIAHKHTKSGPEFVTSDQLAARTQEAPNTKISEAKEMFNKRFYIKVYRC